MTYSAVLPRATTAPDEINHARECAVLALCVHFDRHGYIETFGLLERSRQILVAAVADRRPVAQTGELANTLAWYLQLTYSPGVTRFSEVVDAVRNEFSARRRTSLAAQGWVA